MRIASALLTLAAVAALSGGAEAASFAICIGIGAAIALLCLPLANAVLAVLVAAAAAAIMAMLASRQIGGVTGDVFGAVEQVAETTVLLMLAARLS